MKLEKILEGLEYKADNLDLNAEVEDIIYNSKLAKANTMFVCIKGFQADGHKYAKSAYENGVRIFAVQKVIDLPEDACLIYVDDTRRFLALASAAFFGHPAKELTTVALTGTKGKTSTSFMLKNIFEDAGKKVGVMGTTGIFYDDVAIHSDNSTPESYEIQKHFRSMVDKGVDVAILEATSQGFMLHRTDGILFDYGVFTNLSPDHIGGNEHKDFDDYLNCKRVLFTQTKQGFANIDSKYYKAMVEGAACPIKTYGFNKGADFVAENPVFSAGDNQLKTSFDCVEDAQTFTVSLNIPGMFSVYNALSAITVARELGIGYETIEKALKRTFVKGRMELIPDTGSFTVIIDYAHNELSVQSLFDTIKLYNPRKITVIFGCGGNRSRLRRSGMGQIVAKNADFAYVTSDNPRYESVTDIINDILEGMDKENDRHKVILDRKKAIEHALDNAEEGEVILIIGKGHQLYEEIEGVKHPFDERAIVLEHLSLKK